MTKNHNEMVVDQFTSQAEGYARLVSGNELRRPSATAMLGAAPDDVALDVACGTGALTLQVAGVVAHVTGIDITAAMLAEAREAQARMGVGNVAWLAGDVYSLPFDEGRFSLVFSSAAFHHMERPGEVLGEMVRVCTPGGRIAVIDMTPAEDKAEAFDRIEHMRDPSHVHALPLAALVGLGMDAGLKSATVRSYRTRISYDAVLGASALADKSLDVIQALVRGDAESGADRFGLEARLEEGRLYVSYPMSAVVWTR